MFTLFRIAKAAAPPGLKNWIKRLFGIGSLYQHSSFEVISAWPDIGQAQNWAHPSVIERYKNDFRSFDAETALKSPIIKGNMLALGKTQLRHAKLLDVGCASGLYSALLGAFTPTHEWEYCGVDVSPNLIDFCRNQHPGKRFESIADATILPFDSNAFDVVLASGVLFAIHDYQLFLQELHRVAKTYVLVSRQPVWESLPSQILLQRVIYSGREEAHPVRFFNRSELETALIEIGFEFIAHDYSEEYHNVMGIAVPAIDHYYLLKKRTSQ